MKQIYLVLITVLMCLPGRVAAQAISDNDSLRNSINKAPTDSLRVEALYQYMKANLNNNTSDFEPYIRQMAFLSKKIHYNWGLSTAYILGLSYYKNQGKFEIALSYADSVIAVTQGDTAEDMRLNMGHLHLNRGNLYYNIGDYQTALPDYFQAEQIFKQINYKQLASTYSNIGNCFMGLGNHKKAIEYSALAVSTAQHFGDNRLLATNMMNLATAYTNVDNYAAADSLLRLVGPIVEKLQNSKSFHVYYYNMGDLEAYYRKDTLKALSYYQKSYDYALQNDDVSQQAKALDLMINFQMDLKLPAAKANIDMLYQLAKENGIDDEMASAMDYYSKWYSRLGDYKKAYEYEKLFRSASDSIQSREINEKTAMMEIRFRVANKEQEINQLKTTQKVQQLAIRQKSILNYFLIAGTAAILVISFLGYRNYRHKQKLQQQRITELEVEKQLAATESVLKGEEQERTRLAKDLHDGLGGMLSGIKFTFQNIKENLILTPENGQAFERSIDMLDSSIKEMRRVAHNLMPETLVKYGLNTALKEFCSEINRSGVVRVNYQAIGMDDMTIAQTPAVAVYRIVQELVNNAIKHAAAQNVLVQAHLVLQEKRFTITVEDDGKGFDKQMLKHTTGMGWSNIENRVDFLKGKLDVQTAPGKGTSVMIEIDI